MNRTCTATLAFAAILSTTLFFAPPAVAQVEETDAISCVKSKDLNKIVAGSVTLDLLLSVEIPGCTLMKLSSMCYPTSINSGDDARGGALPAFGYACFKAKCTGTVPNEGTVTTQFGSLQFRNDLIKGTKLVCVPYSG